MRRLTGSRSPSPLTCGWSTERIGRDDDRDGARRRIVRPRVGEPAQHGEAAADGVRARRQPLVRQRLPGRELHDGCPPGRQQGAQRGGQVLRLTAGGGHREHRPAGVAGEGGHREGAGRGRAHQIHVRTVPVGRGLHRFGERRVLYDGVEQTVRLMKRLPSQRGEQREQPDTSNGPGLPTLRPPTDTPRPERIRARGPRRPGVRTAAGGPRRVGAPPPATAPRSGRPPTEKPRSAR